MAEHMPGDPGASTFTRPIDMPGTVIQATVGMTHQARSATSRAGGNCLKQQSAPTGALLLEFAAAGAHPS